MISIWDLSSIILLPLGHLCPALTNIQDVVLLFFFDSITYIMWPNCTTIALKATETEFVCSLQIIILLILPDSVGASGANYAKNLLRAAILVQYIPRLCRFLPLVAGPSSTGFIFESAWSNFVINLLTFVLASHVVGSCWYLFGLQVGALSIKALSFDCSKILRQLYLIVFPILEMIQHIFYFIFSL